MTAKIDYKKTYKELYLPKAVPSVIDVPETPFIRIAGSGDPNGEAFAREIEALYSVSYAVKMSYKSDDVPAGYYEYTVFPLEGVWDLVDRAKPATDKSNLKYAIMIRQPDFLTDKLFERFVARTKTKKPNPLLDRLTFGRDAEGLCCQMMHIGSFDDEPASFAAMEIWCRDNGYERTEKTHREIYLSDPRKVAAAKMKTVLRFPVRPKPASNG